MRHEKDEKWLDDIISEATDLGEVRFDAQKWKDKYILNESRESSSSYTESRIHKHFWRSIMESKITRYSAAAVIFLAITLVLFGPFWSPGNGGVVLADVQQKVADAETMVVRGQKIFTHPGEKGELFEFDGIPCKFDLLKHFSKQHGLVEEGRVEGRLIYRITFNRHQRQALVVLPPWKKYLKFTSTDEQGQLLASMTPKGLIDMLLDSEYRKLGKDKIDGIEVEGFEFHQSDPIKELFPKTVFNIESVEGKVWIGTRDQLPVRIEGDLKIGKSLMTAFNELNLHEINILEQFDAELDDDLFDIAPPEGYTELALTDLVPLIPAEAKAGVVGLAFVPAGFVLWKRRRNRTATGRN